MAISQRHPSKYYSHLQQPPVASDDDDDDDDDENDENDVGSIVHPRPPHPYAVTILAFFESYVRDRFAGGLMSRYVMDVYLDVRNRAWIVDFNVWGGRTDCSPLFDWDELSALGDRARDARSAGGVGSGVGGSGGRPMPEMRVVTADMKSMTYDPLSSYRGPTDVVNLLGGGGGTGGEDGPSFEEFMKQCVRPSKM